MVIDILDTQSIDNLINYISKIETNLQDTAVRICSELAEVAREAMQTSYLSVDGNDIPIVSIDYIPNGVQISANGKSVGFVEFGTGDYVDPSNPATAVVPYTVAPGSWSQSPMGQKHYPPKWMYMNVVYTGTYPANAIPNAIDAVISSIAEVGARELQKILFK